MRIIFLSSMSPDISHTCIKFFKFDRDKHMPIFNMTDSAAHQYTPSFSCSLKLTDSINNRRCCRATSAVPTFTAATVFQR